MSRIASLDFLRGMAAFSVAIPHYLALNSIDWPVAEATAITSVEVFFVLSGFVLAPQILAAVIGGSARNIRIFLLRRWMRTIPPYLVALFLIAFITGHFFTFDLVRYAVYMQNLFSQANSYDFFPVAWSLAVEEWFYLTFAPILFFLAKLLRQSDRKFTAFFGVCFVLAIVAMRACGVSEHWDAEVRRVTIFRVDAIAWGFLLYLAMEKVSPFDLATPSGRRHCGLALSSFVVCSSVGATVAYFTTRHNALSEQVFPFAAAGVGLSAVAFFRRAEFLFNGRIVSCLSFWLGRISYSVYLFHIILVMVLKPKLAGLDLTTQLVIYLVSVITLASAFSLYFEKPILAARPKYDGDDARRERPILPSSEEARRALETS